jgi:hypothetical protein
MPQLFSSTTSGWTQTFNSYKNILGGPPSTAGSGPSHESETGGVIRFKELLSKPYDQLSIHTEETEDFGIPIQGRNNRITTEQHPVLTLPDSVYKPRD